jgi:NTE family protein
VQATGIMLTGGGARGAYQAGVLQGVAEIAKARGGELPFRVVTGSSAGAINAAFVASTADNFVAAMTDLGGFWSNVRTSQIFRTDFGSLGRIGLSLAGDILFGGLKRTKQARSLLDTTPLRNLLTRILPMERIPRHIADGRLDAFEVAATDYHTSESVSFFASSDPAVAWTRARRRAERAEIGVPHVLASAAIPLFFPPVKVGSRYFGDGSLRNPAPLSPTIRLGTRKLLIVGVRYGQPPASAAADAVADIKPTLGRVVSVVLNAILLDALEFDLERLARINRTVALIPSERRGEVPLAHIDYLHLKPSEDLGAFAAAHFARLPELLQYLVSGLGSRKEASEIVSYLLFEPEFCGYLVALGRRDALARRDELEALLFS